MLGIASLLVAFCIGACGDSSTSSDSTSAEASYLTSQNVSQYKSGTPQRAVLQWWKAVQFGNPTLAHAQYAPGMGPSLAALQRELAAASNQFAGKPSFDSAEVRGNRATLYFFVSRPDSSAPPRPVSINLVKTGGEWGLADDQLLAQVVERVRWAGQRPAG